MTVKRAIPDIPRSLFSSPEDLRLVIESTRSQESGAIISRDFDKLRCSDRRRHRNSRQIVTPRWLTLSSLARYRYFSITITTARLFDSHWEEASPRRITHVRTTASLPVQRQWRTIACTADRANSRIGYCRSTGDNTSLGWKWYTRSDANGTRETRGLASQRHGGSETTGIPRASAPPPGWSVGRRSLGRLAGRSTPAFWFQLSLAPSQAQTPQKQSPVVIRFVPFHLPCIPFVIFQNTMDYRELVIMI